MQVAAVSLEWLSNDVLVTCNIPQMRFDRCVLYDLQKRDLYLVILKYHYHRYLTLLLKAVRMIYHFKVRVWHSSLGQPTNSSIWSAKQVVDSKKKEDFPLNFDFVFILKEGVNALIFARYKLVKLYELTASGCLQLLGWEADLK